MDEEKILVDLKQGKEAAFREFFETYYEVLVLFANHLLNDPEAAEDVVQDCFVDFWQGRRFEHITTGIDKYIFQAVKHAALNDLRGSQRRTKRHMLAMQYLLQDGEEDGEKEEEWLFLYVAINRLPEERRRIFLMICLEGNKYQEVADLLQISVNTVKTQMGRAFQFLRETLKGHKSFVLLLFLRERYFY